MMNLVDGQFYSFTGVLVNIAVKTAKTGASYLSGSLLALFDGAYLEYQFKVWNNATAFNQLMPMVDKDLQAGHPVFKMSAKGNVYNGFETFVVTDVTWLKDIGDEEFMALMPQKYNVDHLDDLFKRSVATISEKGRELLDTLLMNNEEVLSKFKTEYAASTHHDNCYRGLYAHTIKVTQLMRTVLAIYPDLQQLKENPTDAVDLLMIGTILHDLGKIWEMHYGVYMPKSVVTHRVLGIEYLVGFKNEIIAKYDEDWYYALLAIVAQHHGEFADPCKSIYSYLVHLVDLLDSTLTVITEKVKERPLPAQICVNDLYLNL